MSPEDVERRIADLEEALPGLAHGSAELRTAMADLAAVHAARYLHHAGAEDDLLRARELADAVLADEAVTPAERQRMSLLQVALTMVAVTPAVELRGHHQIDAEALRRTNRWMDTVDPSGLAAAVAGLQEQLRNIPDVGSLPPEIRSSINLVGRLAPLLNSGEPAEAVRHLGLGLEEAHPDTPGLDLLRLMVTWLRPHAGGERVAELETALAGLSDDHLFTPVLRRDLAQALLNDGLTGIDRVERATQLLEQAAAGMAEDHPMHDETVRMLAGALVTTAASDTSAMSLARAEQVAADVLRQSGRHGPEGRGPDKFLLSLVGLLRVVAGDGSRSRTAIRDLVEAIDLLPADHDLRPFAVGQLGALLADRHLTEGMLEDAETAQHILDRAAAAVSADKESGVFLAGVLAVHRINRATRLDEDESIPAAAAALRGVVERMPPDQLMRTNFELVLAVAELRMAHRTGADTRAAVDVVRRIVAQGSFPGIPPATMTTMAGAVAVLDGLLSADPDAVVDAINRMESELETSTAPPVHLAMRRAMLGKAYLVAHRTGVGRDVAAGRAVGHLAEAERLLDLHRAGVARLDVLRDLASAHRLCGDHERSRHAAFEALASHAGTVLLQTGIAHAVVTARGASTEAAALAHWCLADGDFDGAVQAVELGRGLALHAATSALALPSLLRRVGRPDLADAWVADAAARVADPYPWTVDDGEPVPEADRAELDHARAAADLRHDVLDVLRRTPEGVRLMTAPSAAAVGEALVEVDADALVYLLPGDDHHAGHLLMIDRNGEATAVGAPLLRIEPDGPPVRFQQADKSDEAGWRAALDAACDWAGAAVLEPLLAVLGTRSTPVRVVLVPSGVLGAVPWPAARLHSGRFACVDVTLSTAASARQFLDVAARSMLPLGLEQVLVADPLGELPFAVDEVLTLHGSLYPDAVVLGDFATVESAVGADLEFPDGRGTPAEVLDRLPGVSSLGAALLHLGCHAYTAGSAEASHLALTERLTIRAVLEHGAGRAFDAPGPLVVLSTCVSDLTVHDYDEALTLATAFLAAGAVAVVGSRWPVDDRRTAIMMFAFHHFLARTEQRPAEALRSAQLWMLDPERAELPDMPEAMLGDLTEIDLTDIVAWGAFGHHGR